MAHCPPELLDDLTDLFAEIRAWPAVVEKTRGVFYVRRGPFLHFHRSPDGRRHADIKETTWASFDLPRPLSATRRCAFLRTLRRHYAGRSRAALSTPAARIRSGRRAASSRDSPRGGLPRRGS